jgi:hypothetical protein
LEIKLACICPFTAKELARKSKNKTR